MRKAKKPVEPVIDPEIIEEPEVNEPDVVIAPPVMVAEAIQRRANHANHSERYSAPKK